MNGPWDRLLSRLLGPVYQRLEQQRLEVLRLQDLLAAEQGVEAQAREQLRETQREFEERLTRLKEELARERRRAEGALAEAERLGREARDGLAERVDVRHRELEARLERETARLAAADEAAEHRIAEESANSRREARKLIDLLHEEAQRGAERDAGQIERLGAERINRETADMALATRMDDTAREQAAALGELSERLARIEDPVGEHFDYTAFEDRFRGSEALIRERQAAYLELLGERGPVADLGCGRGEMLDVLNGAGIEAFGVDGDPRQVERGRARSLRIEQADLRDWLAARPENSLGAITLLQVFEHLDLRDQILVLESALRALRPGGVLLIETVNPHCPEALEWFYIDPTHRRPVYPELAQFLMEKAGFTGIELRFQIPCSTAPQDQPPNEKTGADFALWGRKP